MGLGKKQRLRKELGLLDVYVISTGAMISSGFFLLPGLAAAEAGPAVVLAYLLAGVAVLPAMFSMAELATAMPRAGGAYYFLDRSMGPMVGTIAGFGVWLALVLKSAFALIGMGAYLVLFLDLPMKPVAVALTVAFTALNVLGAKETTGLQRVLVVGLLAILAFFLVQGLIQVGDQGVGQTHREQFTPFLPFGLEGLVATVGFVFVSYAGLTQVASVAEEVSNPDRNIPWGMALSLVTATLVYVVGVYIMVAVLDAEAFRSDLTPVATAAEVFLDWLPGVLGLVLVSLAAIAAFASTGNAGILAASRYPLGMARDRLIWRHFADLGRFRTPTFAILGTGGTMVLAILLLDVEAVAKLASAVMLLLFGFVCLAVIVMRESHLEGYRPGFASPWYPWMQIAGCVVTVWLIVELGWLPILFTCGIVVFSVAWYRLVGLEKLPREGAIYHVFERLGRQRYGGLERELREIFYEREYWRPDPYEETIALAAVLDDAEDASLSALIEEVSARLAPDLPGEEQWLADRFLGLGMDDVLVTRGVIFLHLRMVGLESPRLALVRSRGGVVLDLAGADSEAAPQKVHALFFLVSPKEVPGRHLRVLGQLAARVDRGDFLRRWREAEDEHALREILLRFEHSLAVRIEEGSRAADLIGRPLSELTFPKDTLLAVVRRSSGSFIPHGDTVLRYHDRITFIGDAEGIEELYDRYVAPNV